MSELQARIEVYPRIESILGAVRQEIEEQENPVVKTCYYGAREGIIKHIPKYTQWFQFGQYLLRSDRRVEFL
jgi:hypothetical protein